MLSNLNQYSGQTMRFSLAIFPAPFLQSTQGDYPECQQQRNQRMHYLVFLGQHKNAKTGIAGRMKQRCDQ